MANASISQTLIGLLPKGRDPVQPLSLQAVAKKQPE